MYIDHFESIDKVLSTFSEPEWPNSVHTSISHVHVIYPQVVLVIVR